MHSVSYQEKSKMPETKLILWFVYDVFLVGFGGITLLNSLFVHIADIERIIVFMIFATMGIYRIRILHHSSKRKRLENEELEATIRERKEKLNKKNNLPKK